MSDVVTDALLRMIAKQVDDRGIVVWYDPEHAYSAMVTELVLPNIEFARYEGSFLQLRKSVDHLLNDLQPPRVRSRFSYESLLKIIGYSLSESATSSFFARSWNAS